jgi:hypothetical protein
MKFCDPNQKTLLKLKAKQRQNSQNSKFLNNAYLKKKNILMINQFID